MIAPSHSRHLKTTGQDKTDAGGFVFIKALKKLSGDGWLVEVRGNKIEVKVQGSLVPGERFAGRLFLKDGGYEFILRGAGKGAAASPEAGRNPPVSGVPGNLNAAEALKIVFLQAFGRAGVAIPGKERLKGLVDLAAKEGGAGVRKRAALLARLEEKGLAASSETFEGLYAILEGKEYSGGGKKKDRDGRREAETKPLREAARAEGDDASALNLFNHLSAENGNWILLPYDFYADDLAYRGSLRLWYNRIRKGWEKAVLSVREAAEGKTWYFVWHPENRNIPVEVYSDDQDWARESERLHFARKLRKLGLKSDDKFNKEEDFDGFAPGRAVEKFIDTVV